MAETHQLGSSRKKQRRCLELFNLPDNLIKLIIFFIPEETLETYLDIPFLGGYAADRVFQFVEIVPSYSPPDDEWRRRTPRLQVPLEAFKSISKRKLLGEEFLDYFSQIEHGASGGTYRRLKAYEFIQLSKTHPKFIPKIVHFILLDQFICIEKSFPHILKNLPRIDISYGNYNKLPSCLLLLQYKIFQVLDVPSEYIDERLLRNITSLCTDTIPKLSDESWGEIIQELEVTASLDEVSRLFPNLRRLKLVNRINVSEDSFPEFPSLEFLQLSIEQFFEELDISHLVNLREFAAETLFGLDELERIKFPVGIERIILTGVESDLEENLESLDSIESYPNLKEFRIGHGNIMTPTEAFSNDLSYPQSLQKLEVSLFDFTIGADSEEPFVTIGENFPLPNNLKVLHLDTYMGLYQPDKWELPQSLRVLSIYNDAFGEAFEESGYPAENWSCAVFPDSLLELSLNVEKLEGITFPKSLRGLELTFDSGELLKSLNFLELENLVQLKLTWKDSPELIVQFPSSLKTLDLSKSWVEEKIIIEAPNLKRVELPKNRFETLDTTNFQIPDSVEHLSIDVSGKGLSRIEPNIFPKQLRVLKVDASLTSDLLNQLQLGSFLKLERLDLRWNKITCLSNNFPPSLKSICLDNNPISKFSSATVFSELPNLREISMASTKIKEYFQPDESILEFPSSLVALNLADNELSTGVASKLRLLGCTQLQELCLVGNPEMADVQTIVDVIKSSCPDMVELALDTSHVTEEGDNFLLGMKAKKIFPGHARYMNV